MKEKIILNCLNIVDMANIVESEDMNLKMDHVKLSGLL